MTRSQVEVQKARWAKASEIPAHAASAVRIVSEANEKRYPDEPWWFETAEQQVEHAFSDLSNVGDCVRNGEYLGVGGELEERDLRWIEQAIWRLAAARYKLSERVGKERLERDY